VIPKEQLTMDLIICKKKGENMMKFNLTYYKKK
jgi:hypothetical protein